MTKGRTGSQLVDQGVQRINYASTCYNLSCIASSAFQWFVRLVMLAGLTNFPKYRASLLPITCYVISTLK